MNVSVVCVITKKCPKSRLLIKVSCIIVCLKIQQPITRNKDYPSVTRKLSINAGHIFIYQSIKKNQESIDGMHEIIEILHEL